MRNVLWSLPVVFCLGCALNANVEPDGQPLVATKTSATQLAVASNAVFVIDVETRKDDMVAPVLVRVLPLVGEKARLYISDVAAPYPREGLAIDGGFAYFLDNCSALQPTCARLLRVPTDGGAAELLATDRIYGFAVDAGTVYYTTSDERGLGLGQPDGALWRLVPGGAPTMIASGLVGLRDVVVAGDELVTSEATFGPDASRRAFLVGRTRDGVVLGTVADLSASGNARPQSLTGEGRAVYFSHGSDVAIAPLDGSGTTVLATVPFSPSGLTVNGSEVYVTDPGRYDGTTDDNQGVYLPGAVLRVESGGTSPVARFQHTPVNPRTEDGYLYWLATGSSEKRRGQLLRMPIP